MIRDLLTIQYLRAIAAVMIVLHHLPVQLNRMGYEGRWPEVFNSRVDIFFVISGFIIWVSTAGRETSVKDFLLKRLTRIVPLYWLVTAFCVVLMVVWPGTMKSAAFDPVHVLASFFFWPVSHPVTGFIAPVVVPAWTLLYEMAFYLLFALCLPLSPKVRLFAVTLILAVLVLIQSHFPLRASVGGFYTSSIILEFAFGAAIGALFAAGLRLPSSVSILFLVLGCLGLTLGPHIEHQSARAIYYGLPAALILTGAVFFERHRPIVRLKFLVAVGNASYALFLVHGIVLSALGQAWLKIPMLQGQFALYVLTALALVFVVASATHHWVEQPIASLIRRRLGAFNPTQSQAISRSVTTAQMSATPTN